MVISLRFTLGLIAIWAIWCNGNTPEKCGIGVQILVQKPAMSLKRCKTGPITIWRTNRKSHIRPFDWCQNQWP